MIRKSTKTKLGTILGFIVVLSILVVGCAPAATPTAAPAAATEPAAPAASEPVILPFVGPLTGPDGVDGQGAAKAAELAVIQANAAGGVCGGRELVYQAHDTKADPKEGANIATLLCGDTGVYGAMADYNSSVALAEAPVFNECKVSQVNYYAAAPDIAKKGGPYTFRVYPPGQNMSIYIADWLINQKGMKKLAVLYENTDYGKGLFDAFMVEAEKLGAEVVATEAVLKEQTDLSAVISKFKSLEPEAIVGMIQYQVGAYWQMQSRDIGFEVPLYGSDGIFAPEIINLAGDAAEGIRTVAAYTIESSNPVVSKFVADFNTQFKENPNNPAGYAYDATNAIITGLNATNCESREALQAWLAANMVDVKGVTGTITLDAEGERVFAPGMYTPIEVKDGKWVEVVE
jgi:branched-chain amino acid transport system substrate-binding protein